MEVKKICRLRKFGGKFASERNDLGGKFQVGGKKSYFVQKMWEEKLWKQC